MNTHTPQGRNSANPLLAMVGVECGETKAGLILGQLPSFEHFSDCDGMDRRLTLDIPQCAIVPGAVLRIRRPVTVEGVYSEAVQ